MQIVDGENDFGCIEFSDGIGEALRLAEEGEEFTTLDEIHDHVEVFRILESSPEVDKERMPYKL